MERLDLTQYEVTITGNIYADNDALEAASEALSNDDTKILTALRDAYAALDKVTAERNRLREAAQAVISQHDTEESQLEASYRGDPPVFATLRAALNAGSGDGGTR